MTLLSAFSVSDETLQMIEAHKKRLGVTSASDVLRALIRESRVPDTAAMLNQVVVDIATELGCAPDNEEILQTIAALHKSLKEALNYMEKRVTWPVERERIIREGRAALGPAPSAVETFFCVTPCEHCKHSGCDAQVEWEGRAAPPTPAERRHGIYEMPDGSKWNSGTGECTPPNRKEDPNG